MICFEYMQTQKSWLFKILQILCLYEKKAIINTFHANACNQGHKILSKIAFIAFIVLSSIVGILKRNLSVLRSASCRDLDSK